MWRQSLAEKIGVSPSEALSPDQTPSVAPYASSLSMFSFQLCDTSAVYGGHLRLFPRVERRGLHHRSQPYHRRRIRRIIGTRKSTEKRRMARPKEFDQEKALRKAIRLFSQQGFAATSTDDLLPVMEVGRQSTYDQFGDVGRWVF